ncbi:hypothetical protein [Plantactinospora sonchi]|uniref:DUF1622 domain-containing protein n=1 Tax=Plantactinospora sonchi TaxID=1544735 RepID=A0ABU7RY40_9ACTN
MSQWATLLTAVALATAAVVLVTTRSWRTAIRVLLDLLIAAGLIRLSGAQTWTDLAGAAVVVALRQLVSASLLGPGPRSGGGGAGPGAVRPGSRPDQPAG